MKRTLEVVLDETVTDTHCGGCGYRRVIYDENPICSQDVDVLGIWCELIHGDRMVTESGEVHYRKHDLRGDDGELVRVNLYNYDTGEYDPVPDTLRHTDCRARERKEP